MKIKTHARIDPFGFPITNAPTFQGLDAITTVGQEKQTQESEKATQEFTPDDPKKEEE